MTAIPARRRQRTLAALVSGLVGAVMLPSGLVLAGNSLLNSTDGNSVDSSNVITIPSTPAALLAGVNGSGTIASLQMIALAPGGAGGTIVSIPVGSSAVVAEGEAPRRVGDSYLSGGLEALVTEVEGLLNVTFTASAALGEVEMAQLFEGVKEVSVEFDRSVTTLLGGDIVEMVPAGRHTLTGDQVAAVLAASQTGGTEADRLPVFKSLWVGVAESGRVATSQSTTSSSGATDSDLPVAPSIGDFMRHVLTGEMQVWQFAAAPVALGDANPSGSDMYALDKAEIIMVTASVAPSSVSSLLPSINVLIDSPFNDAAVTREAVLRLSYLGLNIVLVREVVATPVKETVFSYTDQELRQDLEGYATVLGSLKLDRVDQRVDGVDARITLGQDFVDFAKSSPSDGLISTPSSTVAEDLNKEPELEGELQS